MIKIMKNKKLIILRNYKFIISYFFENIEF